MIEYKIFALPSKIEKVDEELRLASANGWRVVCSCGRHGRNLIMKRKVKG